MRHWKSYRPLVIVYALAAIVGAWEFHRRPKSMDSDAGKLEIYGSAQRDYADAMARLYPGRADVELLLGQAVESQAREGASLSALQKNPELLEQFLAELQAKRRQVREHYERALKAGLKSDEKLQYNYALTLMWVRADPEEIDQAIAAWRRNFPSSTLTDLDQRRKAIEEEYRQLDNAVTTLRQERELEMRRRMIEQLYGPPSSPPLSTPPTR